VVPAEVANYYLPLRARSRRALLWSTKTGVLAAATVNFVSTGSGSKHLDQDPPVVRRRERPCHRLGEGHSLRADSEYLDRAARLPGDSVAPLPPP